MSGQAPADPARACENGDAMERPIVPPWPGEEIRGGGRFRRPAGAGGPVPGSRRGCACGDAAERPIVGGWPGSEVRIEGRFRLRR
jgi:hypothetical protein